MNNKNTPIWYVPGSVALVVGCTSIAFGLVQNVSSQELVKNTFLLAGGWFLVSFVVVWLIRIFNK